MTKYAQFKDLKWVYVSPMIMDERSGEVTTLVRVSEWVEVEFTPRQADEMVPEQLAAIDADIATVTDKFGKALAELRARRAELLAIVDQRQPASDYFDEKNTAMADAHEGWCQRHGVDP